MTRFLSKRTAQVVVILLSAFAVKVYYSTASVNQLRWILAPTTFLVELVSGSRFEFESYAGYINSEHNFIITASCAGVNFLITAFLMLSLGKLWRRRSQDGSQDPGWRLIPTAALFAYLCTLLANSVRISIALQLHGKRVATDWLSPTEQHRLEGILVYFAFLLALFMVSENLHSKKALGAENTSSWWLRYLFPLAIYYATTLAIPLVNRAFLAESVASDFWKHLTFVLLAPLPILLGLTAARLCRAQLSGRLRARNGVRA